MSSSFTRQLIILIALCAAATVMLYFTCGTSAAIGCIAVAIIALIFFITVSLCRRAEIRRLTNEIDEVLNLGRRLDFSDCREGDVAVLANELEKMVARLSRLTAQLEQEKDSLADSLTDISHQIRTPLTAAELMIPAIEQAHDEEQRKRLVRNLEHVLERISWLVSALLKMAKADAGALHMEARPVSVQAMAHRACAPLEVALDLRNIALIRDIPHDAQFIGDETWCAEALENIVKNSMEHCDAGGTITIRAEADTLACRILVSDDGGGIPEADLPHLFERFYRGSTAKDNEGFGVGLALARALVAGQGGTLRAANLTDEEGAPTGALFTIAFPKTCV